MNCRPFFIARPDWKRNLVTVHYLRSKLVCMFIGIDKNRDGLLDCPCFLRAYQAAFQAAFRLSGKSFCRKYYTKVFGRLFQKAADSKGRAFGRALQGAKPFAFLKIRKGDEAARWAASSRETLSRGFPMRREAAFVQTAVGKPVFRRASIPVGEIPRGLFLFTKSGITAGRFGIQ